MFISTQSVQSSRSGNNDMWVRVFIFKEFGILDNWCSSVKDSGLHVWHILAESGVLILDLVSQLASVAHYQDGSFTGDWLNLLKSGENKDCSLTETRLGLAKNVGTKDGLRNANLLDCRVNRADVRYVSSSF